MKAANRHVGALTILKVDPQDTTVEAFCEVDGCYGMALQRVEMAGYPAGFVCAKHGLAWSRLWRDASPGRLAA